MIDVTTSSMVMEIKVFTKALSNLQLKQYERDIHFKDSMSNLQKVEMKYMYTEWLELLQNSVLKIHKILTLGHPGSFTETGKQTAIDIYLFHDLPTVKQRVKESFRISLLAYITLTTAFQR